MCCYISRLCSPYTFTALTTSNTVAETWLGLFALFLACVTLRLVGYCRKIITTIEKHTQLTELNGNLSLIRPKLIICMTLLEAIVIYHLELWRRNFTGIWIKIPNLMMTELQTRYDIYIFLYLFYVPTSSLGIGYVRSWNIGMRRVYFYVLITIYFDLVIF